MVPSADSYSASPAPHPCGLVGDQVSDARLSIEQNLFQDLFDHRTESPGSRATHQSNLGNLPQRPVCEQQGCLVFWDRDRLWIDVDGTGTVAEVRRDMGRRWALPRAV
jgi:hypothetical protein